VKPNIPRQLEKSKRRIRRKLAAATRRRPDSGRPVLSDTKITYEVADRTRAVVHGGLGAVHQIVLKTGLVGRIDNAVHVLKIHQPYHESDHVLNIAYNTMCGGRTLDDIDVRRNDEVYLDALGVEMIPDPTTAGDFCRRFEASDIQSLTNSINETRLGIWAKNPELLTQRACIDSDGSFVPTMGECKEGMALNYKGEWGWWCRWQTRVSRCSS